MLTKMEKQGVQNVLGLKVMKHPSGLALISAKDRSFHPWPQQKSTLRRVEPCSTRTQHFLGVLQLIDILEVPRFKFISLTWKRVTLLFTVTIRSCTFDS